jgi:3-oxoacyl-[acyl-carrier protein] reductase
MTKAPVSGPINLSGQVGIITGASRGIGQATAVALAREGAAVAVCDLASCADTLNQMSEVGLPHMDIRCNVADRTSVHQAVERVVASLGHIDFLVNNAGILGRSGSLLEDYEEDEWAAILDVNLKGTFLMTQAVWAYMRRQGYGKIVCIGSIAGRVGGVLAGPHYCASKGGIHAFVKWAAKHGASQSIYVNGIAPGPIATPMIANEPYQADMVPLKRLGEPADIAEAALFLVSQASNFITGNILDVNGGMLMI